MSEMVDKVAKAIYKTYGSSLINWEANKEFYLRLARTAIEAMHEPTEEIKSVSTGSIHRTNEEIWKMFIDAALKD